MEQEQEVKLPDLDNFKSKKLENKSKKKRNIPVLIKVILVIFIISLLGITVFSFKVASVGNNIFQSEEKESILNQIKHLVLAEDKEIKGEKDGRTNILLLGMGGEGHQGALLTDTIIVASIKYNKEAAPEVALVSIPRDLGVPLNNSYVKINSVYAYGKMNNPEDDSTGNKTIEDYINNISGLPIHYYAQIDFEGFKRIVDSIGGIEVDVKNSFYDPQYPTENFGYQRISFEKGLNQMNGDLALKYARSRHGIVTDGNEYEGSDFARAKRQQQILTSVKDKAFSVSTVINPKKINEILSALGDHVRTNMEPWEILKLADIAQNIDNEQITNKVIDQESGLLSATNKSRAYILMPNDKDYIEIKEVFENIFNPEQINTEENSARLAILNGTLINGLANRNANELLRKNFKISYTGNAKNTNYEKTVIYDLTSGKMTNSLESLIKKFNANLSPTSFSEKISKSQIKNLENIDFIVILGLDSDN